MDKNLIGKKGEEIARKFLETKSFKILELNYKISSPRNLGEIDIIAMDKDELVFIEVKSSYFLNFEKINPEERIDFRKIRKMEKVSQLYIAKKNLWHLNYRFDAISVFLDEFSKNAKIKHLRNIYL